MDWHLDFSQTLLADYQGRKKKNPRYSLRSFAKRVGLASGMLSDIINQRRNWQISVDRAAEILDKLSLSRDEKNRLLVKMGLPPQVEKTFLSDKDHEILRRWIYYPILFSFELPEHLSTPSVIARKLGVSELEVAAVIEDLLARNLLLRDMEGRIFKPKTYVTTADNSAASEATIASVRKSHEDNFNLARHALYEQPKEKRDISAYTFVGNKMQIDSLREEIRSLYEKASALMTQKAEPDTLYRLSVQLFPLEFKKIDL